MDSESTNFDPENMESKQLLFKGLTMDAEQMRRFVDSCVAPTLTRDDNSSSTKVSPKLVAVIDAWLGDDRYVPLFTVKAADGSSPLSLLNTMLDNGSKVKIDGGFLAKLLDRLSKYFTLSSSEGQLSKNDFEPEDMLPLARHLLEWLGSKQPLKHKVLLEERMDLLKSVMDVADAEFVRSLIGRLSEFPVSKLPDDQVSVWFGALESACAACRTLGEQIPEKAFKLLSSGTVRDLHFRVKVGLLLASFTDLKADKDTALDPSSLLDGYRHTRRNFLHVSHCALGHINGVDLGQMTPALDSMMLLLGRIAGGESEEEFNFVVQQFLMKPIQLGLRNREDAPYSAFVTLLQFILKTGKFRGLEDLRGITCVDDEEADFLENMRHLQVHRRTREAIQ